MPVTFQSLPREVVDLCIDELDHNKKDGASRKALLACNQVSRAFSARARQHLFKQISYNGEHLDDVLNKLYDLREIIKEIAHCVKVFEVIVDSQHDTSNLDYEDLLKDDQDTLSDIVSELPALRKFSLAMTATPYKLHIYSFEWSGVNPTLQDAIRKVIRQPSLSVLHLGNIYGLPSDFLEDTTLQHLHVAHTRFTGDAPPPARANKRLGCVTMNPSDCLEGIAGGYKAHLEHLITFSSTIFNKEHLDVTREVIQASADSLKSLQVDFYENFPLPLLPLNLGSLSQIKNLAVTHTVTMPDEGMHMSTSARFDQDVEHIHTLLDTPTTASTLRTVQLLVTSWQVYPSTTNFFGTTTTTTTNHPSSSADASTSESQSVSESQSQSESSSQSKWHFIDTLLTGPKYPSLAVVGLFLTLPILVDRVEAFDQKAFKKKVEEFFKAVLPKLAAAKRIKFMFEVQVVLFGWNEEQAGDEDDEDEDVGGLEPFVGGDIDVVGQADAQFELDLL